VLFEPIAFYHMKISVDFILRSRVHPFEEQRKDTLQQKLENMARAHVGGNREPRGIWKWTRSLEIREGSWASLDDPPMENQLAPFVKRLKL